MQLLFTALALVLVFEGILPFLCPECWRKSMLQLATQPNQTIRWVGLISMLAGVILIYVVHSLSY